VPDPLTSSARLCALRGAVTVEDDTSDDIAEATGELLGALLERNGLGADDIVSIVFTATPDLKADFPAVAARRMGLSATPMLCGQELDVEDAMKRCIRVLMHCYLSAGRGARHVYLGDARQLRLDLPE
jgi:chorismate mutase